MSGGVLQNRLATKDKTAAPVQISAEQLLREAAALQSNDKKPISRRLVDEDELHEFRVRKRKDFEDQLRRRRYAINIWIRYGIWEAQQLDFRRARSIFERALEVDYQSTEVWNAYLDMEIKNEFVNFARNLFDRVTNLMPRLTHFWLRYTAFEEALQMYIRVREIFERWMMWQPDDRGWLAYVRFEERCEEYDRARSVLERYLVAIPEQKSFLKFARWENEHNNPQRARSAYQKALEILPREQITEKFYHQYAQFEESRKEIERAKIVYQEGIKHLTADSASALQSAYLAFQRRLGTSGEVEDVILSKRKMQYLKEISDGGEYNYDLWFSLIRIEREAGTSESVRETFEKAVKAVPPVMEKAHWKRYFYLWLHYAVFEELIAQEVSRAASVWERFAQVIPHSAFSFAKFWKFWAHFEVRRKNLHAARLIFGRAIGQYPAEKIFKSYSEMEMQLGEIERARKICGKFIECQHKNPRSWIALADLELLVKEPERARTIFEKAINRKDIANVEVLWKAYIDMEANLNCYDRAKALFKRLYVISGHWKVVQGLAEFNLETEGDIEAARKTYEWGILDCKHRGNGAERYALLSSWLKMEKLKGNEAKIKELRDFLPKKIRKRRTVLADDGVTTNIEEYTAYIFPDDDQSASSIAILEAVKNWKKQKEGTNAT